MMWKQDDYIKAWNFACVIHNGQTMPGSEIPYVNHLGLVAQEALATIAHNQQIQDPNLLVLCALLHDAIEDTSTSYSDIEKEFGTAVADGVQALTKNEKLASKAAQMEDSLQRIKQQPKEVWMVKLCDRITNLQPPPHYWDNKKIARYREEAKIIHEQLAEADQFLAERLRMKIDSYGNYLS